MNKKNNNSDIKKLEEEIISLKRKLMNLNFQKTSGQLEKTAEIKVTKKSIARLKTKICNIIGVQNA